MTSVVVLLLGICVATQALPTEGDTEKEEVLRPAAGFGPAVKFVAKQVAKSVAIRLAAKALWKKVSKTKPVQSAKRWVLRHVKKW